MQHTAQHGSLAGYSNQLACDPATILTMPCDVLVPAAMERVIDAQTAQNLKCRVLAEGANGPTTPEADLVLEKRQDEVFLIPDILCNSGGVIVSYYEWLQNKRSEVWDLEEVEEKLAKRMKRTYLAVSEYAATRKCDWRNAAMCIALGRLAKVYGERGIFP
jgi:glutamate dehydrogenase (NAD(P)+)